ncbi:MAG: NfeD family protein [Planctomycetota bacterium]
MKFGNLFFVWVLLLGVTCLVNAVPAFAVESGAATEENAEGLADADDVDGEEVQDGPKRGQESKRRAVIIPMKEDINPLSGALFKRKFEEALATDPDVIILDIHSPGGWTGVTFDLMDMVLAADDVETVAWIEKDAISGAALLALSTDTILMRPDARMGDAGEIVMGPDGAYRYTEAKSRSVLAQKVRDTASATGRPPTLAEKMTNRDMIVYRVSNKTTGETRFLSDVEWDAIEDAGSWEKGPAIREASADTFLTVNGERAVELGLAEQTVASRDELVDVLNVGTPMVELERSWVDTVVLILNSGFVTFLLVLIGLIALAVELSAPGIGAGGLLSALCFGLFFWSRFLGGTSGWLELTLFVLGLLFIAMEVFVIPGFGIAGISGLVLSLGALVMASRRVAIPETAAQWSEFGTDVMTIVGAFLMFLFVIMGMATFMGDIPFLRRLTLTPQVVATGQTIVVAEDSLPAWQRVEVGDQGVAMSPLRPSGKILVGDDAVDVITEGDFVDAGTAVRVVGKQGARLIVRTVEDADSSAV